MKKTKLNYICTDQDCAQYVANFSDSKFSIIECRKLFEGYAACHAVVDLTDYSLDKIIGYCDAYYDSLEQIVEDYGFRDALRIMAECIYEQLPFDDMEFNALYPTKTEAIRFIEEWIKDW